MQKNHFLPVSRHNFTVGVFSTSRNCIGKKSTDKTLFEEIEIDKVQDKFDV